MCLDVFIRDMKGMYWLSLMCERVQWTNIGLKLSSATNIIGTSSN